MDDVRFQEAQSDLAAKDYRAAAEGFLAAAGGPGGPGNGEAYHLAGNALMKLRKYHNAVTVYQHALRDTGYHKRTSVLCNLATAQAALGDYAEAVSAFDEALKDLGYAKHFKLLQGRAGALYKMGRFEEAAEDYRTAASEPGNPDRGKAYNNLGLTLAAAGKPAEAVEAYKSALAVDGYDGKGKAAVNLGLTYAALGMHAEAVRSFEMAVDGYGHTLSDAALDALESSRVAIGAAPQRETVEGWRTGEMPPVPADDSAPVLDPLGSAEEDSRFFTVTDSEMKEIDRANRRREKADKRAGHNPWARAAGGALAVVLVVAACAGVFFAGFGWPTQRGTVSGMLGAYHSGRPVTDFWVAAPAADVGKEMATIPPTFKDFSIDAIDRSAFTSKVKVTVKLDKGAPLHYLISLSREGVGWKVVGIDNDWGSTAGS